MAARIATWRLSHALFILVASLLWLTGSSLGQSGTISVGTFGMQCGPGASTNCPVIVNNNKNEIVLPTVPGTLRLWDSEVEWSAINPSCSTPPCTNWNWTILDYYLDAIVADPTLTSVVYTFGWVPCWDASSCSDSGNHRTSTPPSDLGSGSGGSATFNAFVTALVQHCNANGNCVGKCPTGQMCNKTNLIQYYELWNEANSTTYWNGTVAELYEMVKPAVTIIQNNVTGPVILTPSGTANGGESWLASWLQTEVSSGIISNIYNFHTYLNQETPEWTWQNVVAQGTAANPGLLYPNYHTTGWTPLSWGISETNFMNGSVLPPLVPYTCFSYPMYSGGNFSVADCTGQVVRWQLILNSNGALSVDWYYYKTTIEENSSYNPAYDYMVQYLTGGSFTSPCASNNNTPPTITCAFTEANHTTALWVWTTSENNTNYTVPSGYKDYRDLSGGKTCVTPGSSLTITVEPIMFEKVASCP